MTHAATGTPGTMGRYDDEVTGLAAPLVDPGDLDELLDRVGDARVVLLGEASHGTHEFYAWRAAISRRLIEEKGFSFVAVEGDWPDCERMDRSVRGLPDAATRPARRARAFERWPTWMWANQEVVDFADWLRARNARAPRGGAGRLLRPGRLLALGVAAGDPLWLREHDPEHVPAALARLPLLPALRRGPAAVRAAPPGSCPTNCEDEVVDLLVELRRSRPRPTATAASPPGRTPRSWPERRALLPHDGARRPRVVERPRPAHGRHPRPAAPAPRAGSKAIVWAHNTHVGDARATDMADAGEVNIGQLARERYGADEVVLVGFGTPPRHGRRRRRWGAPMEVMPVPPGAPAFARGSPARRCAAAGPVRLPARRPDPSCSPTAGPPRRSASSTTRSGSAGATTCRRCSATATTPSSGSTESQAVRPLHGRPPASSSPRPTRPASDGGSLSSSSPPQPVRAAAATGPGTIRCGRSPGR